MGSSPTLPNFMKIKFPIYLPDATMAVIRSLDSRDLEKAGVEGVVVNTYHLAIQPGVLNVKKFMNWKGLVVSDSGGFQLLSLIYKDKSFGRVTDEGVIFYKGSKKKHKKYSLTPEKSIQIQLGLGADILICLDDCPKKDANPKEIKKSVERTIAWAKRCKEEFLRHKGKRPLLFAVVQGGNDKKLRKYCAKELIKIGFDGYCFGGWPLDGTGKIDLKILKFVSSLLPKNKPKFALGIGDPKTIIECFKFGYNIFDCVLPTRDARHQRLYVLKKDKKFQHLYISKNKYEKDFGPISKNCDCHTCRNYSLAYLHHLFKIGDSLAWRLATIHNLRTYTKLIEILRKSDKIK